MKKLIVIAIIAMMITGLSVAANAAFVGTVLQIEPVFATGSYQPVLMGWWNDAEGVASVDGADVTDSSTTLTALDGQLRFNLGAISGVSGAVNADFKQANIVPGDLTQSITKRWIITAQIETNPDHIGGTFALNAGFNPGFAPVDGVEFYIFAGTVSTTNAKLWASDPSKYIVKMTDQTTSFNGGNFTIAAPTSSSYYDEGQEMDVTVWGANPSMTFTVYAQGGPLGSGVVPEPGSMLAMFSGLVGLVGFGIRRRK